eukprot:CAMPEP_0114131982 /NCGR_PEP_ID=MMETSP0043_2-20121206/12848_1 /TAXON_ID=464988 /ORGANISM="Hemiselmis andersenii, Strain CCMP644" /LENGTH=153 /DNA_ID=CAMNT_0001225459 /DNA_START=314 /DNA_END=775 /DNA_ORIENTATION=-
MCEVNCSSRDERYLCAVHCGGELRTLVLRKGLHRLLVSKLVVIGREHMPLAPTTKVQGGDAQPVHHLPPNLGLLVHVEARHRPAWGAEPRNRDWCVVLAGKLHRVGRLCVLCSVVEEPHLHPPACTPALASPERRATAALHTHRVIPKRRSRL